MAHNTVACESIFVLISDNLWVKLQLGRTVCLALRMGRFVNDYTPTPPHPTRSSGVPCELGCLLEQKLPCDMQSFLGIKVTAKYSNIS